MGLLEELNKSLRNYRKNLEVERGKVTEYQKKVDDIAEIYEAMKEKKKLMTEQKKSVKTFVSENHVYWKGNLLTDDYQKPVKSGLVNSGYTTIITDIDNNLDELRNKKTEYENKILSSKGIMGSIESSINSLGNSIAKLLN
ncbi:DUF5082 family protein [Vagococcus sp. BWB3-3]|uniref:DUF5082 family protein n=1 Tax=Vagococcus allomyrinae TaxID=2794353 RepID=A0A940SY56_9ENTE|nr:DUF5082 family protein [Vagococcus allomyrinae]MBP1043048.1 DUF5082 family protein [Vagococcus allomyrinae]